ncbi:hypothetical protein ABZS81_22065 [Streptomyces sp. NPDC005318]|uniref:hypothetical protein n=1 Tax=Streptomyces sp. NPDC005318 TaxID=3157031 RepID=UPI0033B9C565
MRQIAMVQLALAAASALEGRPQRFCPAQGQIGFELLGSEVLVRDQQQTDRPVIASGSWFGLAASAVSLGLMLALTLPSGPMSQRFAADTTR